MDIKKADRAALKSYFVKNAIPTESHFADLVDAGLNQKDDGIVKLPGEPLSLQAEGADASLKRVLNFYRTFADAKPAFTISLTPRAVLAAPATARAGWSVDDGDGHSRLFIDQATGFVGLGTVDPGPYRLRVTGNTLVENAYAYVLAEKAGRLRVGAAWNMPGLYSSDDGPNPLTLGVAAGQKVYLGVDKGDAWVEGGTGNAWFKGNVGVGVAAPAESLDVRARLKAGPLTIGPWPANAAYAFVGANNLDQGNAGNYALLQGTSDGPGRTFLNSPLDIRFRIGNVDKMILDNGGNVGIGILAPSGRLHVQTGGAGGWDKFVVNTTKHWGDGEAQYVTIGEGGAAGIMLYNPHVVWYEPEKRASIRMGRSRGRREGHFWDVGVRDQNDFSVWNTATGATLLVDEKGTVTINTLQLGQKFRLSGVGDYWADDDWLRMCDKGNKGYHGGFAAGKLWSNTGNLSGSDVRMKTAISPLEDATAAILRLRAVRFCWREGVADGREGLPSLGLVAQEVESVFPEAVSEGPGGMKGINYALLVAPLIDVVQRQQAQIESLRAEIRTLAQR